MACAAARCVAMQHMQLQGRHRCGPSSYKACSNMVCLAEREVPMWPTQLRGMWRHCVAVRGVTWCAWLQWGQRRSASRCEACCNMAHAGGRGVVTCAAAREAAPWPCS